MKSTSPLGKTNGTDWFKATRGAVVTLAAGIFVVLLQDFLQTLMTCNADIASCPIDFGAYDFVIPTAISVVGMALELIRRKTTDYSK